MQLSNYIQSYFDVVAKEQLDLIASKFKQEELQRNDYFLKEGDVCNKLSFIASGSIRIFNFNDKKEITQWISTPGFFITELSSFLFDKSSRWNMQALNDVSLYTIYKKDYLALGKELPQWHEIEKYFIAKCFTIVEDRVYSFLSMSAEERYQQFFEHHKELFQQVPLQYIASMLGMSAETLSRIRGK